MTEKTYKRYTLSELSEPATYENNPKLATIARGIVATDFQEITGGKIRMGELKRQLLAGEYPDLVKERWDTFIDGLEAKEQELAAAIKAVEGLTPPNGYTLEVDEDELLIKGSYCPDLAKRLKRKSGYWDGLKYDNRKCFAVPVTVAKSLNRIFRNWEKSALDDHVKAMEAKERAEAERWLGYVESAAGEGRLYENGIAKLSSMDIDQWEDLASRLEQAKALVVKIQAEKKAKPSYGKSWKASRNDFCKKCDKRIHRGQEVHYRYQHGEKYLEHVDCESSREEIAKKEAEAPYRIGGGSGYGYMPYSIGQVVKTEKDREGREDWPDFLYVVEAEEEYVKYDGMSFGVGDEKGYLYSARCRAATDEEAAPLKASIAEAERKKDAENKRKSIAAEIRKTGEYPKGNVWPEGEKLSNRANIYGSGDWFVIGPEFIWYVLNHGMDGDDWSVNNIGTGGAGAMGWRIPYSDEMNQRLREVLEITG